LQLDRYQQYCQQQHHIVISFSISISFGIWFFRASGTRKGALVSDSIVKLSTLTGTALRNNFNVLLSTSKLSCLLHLACELHSNTYTNMQTDSDADTDTDSDTDTQIRKQLDRGC